jgi:hypothetical protein
VCNVRGVQYAAELVQDGPGQALVAWVDHRARTPDVYLSRLDASGYIGNPLPRRLSLRPPYPNPTGGRASISFDLPQSAPVDVDVLDLGGRVVRTLLEGNVRPFGRNDIGWDSSDDDGRLVPNGMCFIRVRAPGLEASQRIAVIR